MSQDDIARAEGEGMMPRKPDWDACRDCGTKPHRSWCHAEMMRQTREEAWEEGYLAAIEWIEACSRPADIGPPDPPLNPYEGAEEPKCGCYACIGGLPAPGSSVSWLTVGMTMMIVCFQCGNKRCPHGTDHRNVCTGSNEPGQEGSRYA